MNNNPIRLSTPTELIAAIPAMLGFHPTRSVVSVMLGANRIAAVLRSDIAHTDSDRRSLASTVADHARTADVDLVVLIAIADAEVAGPALRTLDEVRAALNEAGVFIPSALHVPRIEEGMAWTDLDTYDTGVCSDPQLSAVHTHAVVKGTVVEGSREELAAQYARGRTVSTDDLREAMSLSQRMGADEFARSVLSDLHTVIRAGYTPPPSLAARIGILFPLHVVARDAALALALSEPTSAHDAMAAIARQLDGIARAEALTVAGYYAYAGGNGPRAGIAFDAAYDALRGYPANPPRLLDLLNKALTAGLRPAHILDLAHTGHEEAVKLRLDFPGSDA